MPFFSKLKKAKEAAAEHKKEATVQEEKQPKVPYKHVPVHAAIDSLAATPSSMSSTELREKIAAARRSRSVSSASAPAHRTGTSTYYGQAGGSPTSRSRPASVNSSASYNGSLGKRTTSDLSISTMMQTHSDSLSRGRQSARTDHFSQPLSVPAVPQLPAQHRPTAQKTVSSRSNVTKRRSPLSAMSITEDHAGETSGEPSSSSEQSDASVASSQSSTTEVSRPNSSHVHNKNMAKDLSKGENYSRPLSTIVSAATTPIEGSQTQQQKHQAVIEVSSKPELTQRKSMKQRLSFFSRKSMVIAAH